jgi:hypothetical protein
MTYNPVYHYLFIFVELLNLCSPSLLKAEDYKISASSGADDWNFIENHMETEEERSKIGASKTKEPMPIPTQRSVKEGEIRTTL